MTETKAQIPFIVESGNWKARVVFHPVDNEINSFTFMEACTRAFEYVFGDKDNEDVSYISLRDKNGKEYIDVLYKKEVGDEILDAPDSGFGVVTLCRLEDDENNKDKWILFNTSQIFINASLYKFLPYAEEAERRFQTEMDKIEKIKKKSLKKRKSK